MLFVQARALLISGCKVDETDDFVAVGISGA